MTKVKSILLLGNYRPSLILARTFQSRGYKVVVGSHGCERLCQHSSAVSGVWDHSPLNNGPETFANEIRRYAEQNPGLVAIVPVAEEYVRLIAENEELFGDLPSIVTMQSELVKKCLDKSFMLNLAVTNRVPTAPFRSVKGFGKALEVCRAEVGFPVIIRPEDSTKRISGQKAVCIQDEAELADFFQNQSLENEELLLQRKFEGRRHNVYFAAIDGEITRTLHAVIDRTDKIDGTGLAVEGRTLEPAGPLVEQTDALVRALNYSGIGCAQFLVNPETGASSFLEINPRVAGNHGLPEYAGLDLGGFNLERVLDGVSDKRVIRGAPGLRYCWTTGDLMGAKVAFLRNEIDLRGLVYWVGKAIGAMVRSDVHMVFSVKDPLPAFRAIWNLVPRIARWRKPETSPGENTIYSTDQRRPT